MQTDNTALHQRFFLLPMTVGAQDGDRLYSLFTQNQVVEVLGRRTVYPVPFSPAYLRGVIQRYDSVVPVIDVDLLCGGVARAGGLPPRQFLLVRTGQREAATGDFLKLAFACSEVVQTFKMGEQELGRAVVPDEAPPAFAGQGLTTGFFRLREHRVVLLDCNAIARGIRPGAHGAGSGRN